MKWSLLGAVVAIAGCSGDVSKDLPEGGTHIYVSFAEREGLEGGELVRLHGFDIGYVEEVDLDQSRVRAKIVLSPKALSNLTESTTFEVGSDDSGRYLETHVLDPDAAVLAEGATVAAVHSSFELATRRARTAASELMEEVSELASDMKRELDAIEWKEGEQALEQHASDILAKLETATESGLEELQAEASELARELEQAGRSEEAQKLKERFEALVPK